MAEITTKKVAFPRFGHYNLCIKYFVEQGMNTKYILQPPMTRRTMEIGSRYSPDYVCSPFKVTLGSMIDALEAGADTIVMTMGLCRLGYYGELQEQILRELGYEFDFINLSEYSTGNMKDYLKALHRINPKASLARMAKVMMETLKMLTYLDEMEAEYYKNCGFEVNRGDYKKAWNRLQASMQMAAGSRDIEEAYQRAKQEFESIPLDKPDQPLRVGVIGEYYTVMDAFSNLDLEQKLADMGVEVHRWMNFTNRNLHYKGKNLSIQVADYCKYEMGPTSTANIWCAKNYASRGFDGLIHVKSADCTPEIDVMPVLQNISADDKIPILFLSFDSQTSDTGLETRLEAFYDMISMRKRGR